MALAVLPNPELMTWLDWSDTVIGFNPGLETQIGRDIEWPEFADRLTLLYPATPRAEAHDTWQKWVIALKIALNT